MSKYKKVYQDIKKKIEEQVWSTGQALPTENELMDVVFLLQGHLSPSTISS
ncbi:hypothetical protein SSU98_0382 [Streptococcus suis 98HAH33]|nr:hypothetical protein SSU98_0382 [Streptococcus suis 98HAH33]